MMAAVLGFAACSKAELAHPETGQKGMVLHATVAQTEDTKATFTDNEGVWHFDYADGDQITVYNKVDDNTSLDYTFTYNGTDFISTDAEPTLDTARWYAFYPSKEVSLVDQTGKWEDLANVYALVGSTPYGSNVTGKDGLDITMNPKCAVLKIINQKGSIDINVKSGGNWVKGLSDSGSSFITKLAESKQTLLSTSERGAYYIAVPAGIALTVYDGFEGNGDNNVIKSTSKGLKAGKYYEITVIPAGALPGVFSVSATKQVYFSQGNLYADCWDNALYFEENQNSIPSKYVTNHVSHLTWSSDIDVAASDTNRGGYLFCDENHKASVDGSDAIYYALSTEEWLYLFDNHSYNWATVNGVNGIVLAPDGFSGTLSGSYANDAALAADNLVFLPAAGRRMNLELSNVGDTGYYWSSSAYDGENAYFVHFINSDLCPEFTARRYRGYCIRLVTDVN